MLKNVLTFKLRGFTLLAAILTLAVSVIAPAQFPVVLHKFSLVTLSAILGYWLDRHIFPESRPSDLMEDPMGYHKATLRRVILIAATMIAFAVAL